MASHCFQTIVCSPAPYPLKEGEINVANTYCKQNLMAIVRIRMHWLTGNAQTYGRLLDNGSELI
jgi:hypothetical protein